MSTASCQQEPNSKPLTELRSSLWPACPRTRWNQQDAEARAARLCKQVALNQFIQDLSPNLWVCYASSYSNSNTTMTHTTTLKLAACESLRRPELHKRSPDYIHGVRIYKNAVRLPASAARARHQQKPRRPRSRCIFNEQQQAVSGFTAHCTRLFDTRTKLLGCS